MKIAHKFTWILLGFTLAVTSLFYVSGLLYQNKINKQIAQDQITRIKAAFQNLEERDTKILFAALEVIAQDPGIRKLYLEKNRNRLYTYTQPLFQNLKTKYGITHFYFILPDGCVFLRMHDQALAGDLIKRTSFQKARATRGPGQEIELGKTAIALRAVMPYYSDGNLIGYLELGEEIDHFLTILKKETRDEFSIVGEKEYLDRGDWKSAREFSGLRDNWDDLQNHLVLAATSEGALEAKCFVENNLQRIEKGDSIFGQLSDENRSFTCGGFELADAGGQHIGAILSLLDMTEHAANAREMNRFTLGLAVLLFFVPFAAGTVISRSFTRPIVKLAEVAKAIGKGDFNQRVDVDSTDELGQLQTTFNDMLEKQKRSTEEERARLVSAIESAADAIVITDNRGIIKYVNHAFEQMTGYTREEAHGNSLHLLDSGRHDETFFRELRRTLSERGGWKGILINKKKDGTLYHEECTCAPIRNQSGDIIDYVYVKRDITEKMKLESIAQTVETMNNIGYIFSGIRHEIGNPVSGIKMTLGALEKKLEKLEKLEKPAIREYLDRSLAEVGKIEYLLRSLRNFNMYEKPELTDVPVRDFMEKFIALSIEDLNAKGIEVVLSIGPDAMTCHVDPRSLQQILLNLLTNATDALIGRDDPRVSMDVFRKDVMITIRMADNGCGIAEVEQRALFKPFHTTKVHGTGLGLVIARKMLTLMNSHIEITSRKDIGTIVEIIVPAGRNNEHQCS